MKCNAETIPIVEPMMVRKIIPLGHVIPFGGILVMDEYDVEEVGLVDKRTEWDEDVLDCSNRMFQITNWVMNIDEKCNFSAFPSRRFRSFRTGIHTWNEDEVPSEKTPLLYLGNPVKIFVTPPNSCTLVRIPEFLIKSGMELGY